MQPRKRPVVESDGLVRTLVEDRATREELSRRVGRVAAATVVRVSAECWNATVSWYHLGSGGRRR
jgi:hypothetical protein